MTQVTQADRARENKRRLMLKLARGHDGIVSEREQGAELALKCGNGIATNYWGHLAKVAVRHFARHREQAVQEAVAPLQAEIEEQARIIGSGGERELALMAQVAERDARIAELEAALRCIDSCVSHGKMGDWPIALMEIRQTVRAALKEIDNG